MTLRIVPSARQPFVGGSRVVFSVEGDNSCLDRVRSESIPMERRKCHWKAIRLSGPLRAPTGFEVPSCFEPTVTVEFPVEPGEWLLTATNSRNESFGLRYSVGGFPAPVHPRKPVPFRDLDPEVVLARMRKAVGYLERIESNFSGAPHAADHTAVEKTAPAQEYDISRASLEASIQGFDSLLAASRGQRRYALRVRHFPGAAREMEADKGRSLHAFASLQNGIWTITDWTSLGNQGTKALYARAPRSGEEIHGTETRADILADLEAAVAAWRARWPYGDGWVRIEGQVGELEFSGGFHAETPGKDAAKWASFLDGVSMITLAAGFVVPPFFVVSMIAGATAASIRVDESLKRGEGIEDNLLDVLFLVVSPR
ncbi:MAG TPA: hypothetical protein PKO15_00795 [Fibrobacteria bacterium]|nr:hypothetical protein [Fibrobacteria bacterium]